MAFNFVPAGTILPFGGASAPSGWLLCDGSAVSRTTYAALFANISTAWGYGDNSTTFNLPDMRGRFPRGRDAGIARDPDRASRTAANTGGNTGDAVGSVQVEATKKNSLALSGNVSGGTASLTGTTTFAAHGHGHGTGSIGAALGGYDAGRFDYRNMSGVPSWAATRYVTSVTVTNGGYNAFTEAIPLVGSLDGSTASGSVGISSTAASNGTLAVGAGDNETRPLNANVNFIIKI